MIDGVGTGSTIWQDHSHKALTQQSTATDIDNIEVKKSENSKLAGEANNLTLADKDQAQQAVDKLNKTMETYNSEIHFELHEKSGEFMVKIINSKDHTVIREIPTEKVLNMVAYFKEMLGLMVDKFA